MKRGLLLSGGMAVALHAVGLLAPLGDAGKPPLVRPEALNLPYDRVVSLVTRPIQAPADRPLAAVQDEVSDQPRRNEQLPSDGRQAGAPEEPAHREPQTTLPGHASPEPGAGASGEGRDGPSTIAAAASPPLPMDANALYLPRRLLTRPPSPVAQVLLTYPKFPDDESGSYRAELSLFIGSDGQVIRVRLDTPLPEALEGEARRAFLGTRFTPGELNGRPVRSLIRVEVQFDRGDTTPE